MSAGKLWEIDTTTAAKTNLALHILQEFHGDCVADIGKCMINRGATPFRVIIDKVCASAEKIKKGLQVLIQHGIVDYQQNKNGIVEYRMDVNSIIFRLLFPRAVQCAGHLYGDVAEMIVEELILRGRLPASILITTITDQVNESLRAQNAPEIQPSLVRDKLDRLMISHFIRRCKIPVKGTRGRVVSLLPQAPELMFTMPKESARRVDVKQEPDGTASKRLKTDNDKGNASDPLVYLEINYQHFLHHFRDQAIVAAVASQMDSEKPAEIVRTILRYSEKTSDPAEEFTVPMSSQEILNNVPKDLGLTKQMLQQWLRALTDDMPEFIFKRGNEGDGMYSINVFKALKALALAHIESTVQERFGSQSLRIFRVIYLKKYVEQLSVGKLALMPAAEVKNQIYKMFADNFLETQQLSKTPDYAASRSFYLYHVNMFRITCNLLQQTYKSIRNIRIKRELVSADNRRLLDKEERVEAVLNSMRPQLETLDEVERQQEIVSIEDSITPTERQQLRQAKAINGWLEAGEQQLANVIFLLENYILSNYRDPPQNSKRGAVHIR